MSFSTRASSAYGDEVGLWLHEIHGVKPRYALFRA